MKKIAPFSIIVLMMLLTTACGGSAPSATQAPAATQALVSSVNTNEVKITLIDNKIQSSLTEFKVGVPYTFVIANAGRHAHNFNISTSVSIAGSLDNALATALLKVDKSQLGINAIVTVQYTFADSAAGAQLEFSCLIRRHYEDGMYLPITVTK
jgi:uncharacterized cupredoxin-like copper-binding protein